jgi:hypothetical protein
MVSEIHWTSKIPQSIPGALVTNRNRELDRPNISHDDWLATRYVHIFGWLLAEWRYNLLSGPFLPPPQLDAVAHRQTIPARFGFELCCKRGHQETTECVRLLRMESVEVSVFLVDDLVVPRSEDLFGRDQGVCVDVGQDVSPGATCGLLRVVGAGDGRPDPYRDGHQCM